MQNQRVLVTGGAGFIGSNLANHLARDNDVIAVDDTYLGTPENLDDTVEFVEASVLDDDLPADVDVLFHLAALSSRNMHEENPQRGCRVNVEGFVNTVEQVREHGCDTVVYASTSSIYGSRTEPSPESMAVESQTAYEASKLARERYAEYYAHHHDMAMAGLRFFSVYQGFGGNEEHKGKYANTVAQFADAIANGDAPELFGDGTQTRDFTHVEDVARACELAADHELTGVYNVGTEEAYTFNEMVEMINDALGTDIDPEYIECPFDGYVHDTMADITKFHEATGWEPQISFKEGVERVCEPYLAEKA
ncbi:NAD-dependent epimerase/dehydratase family protein [Halonotius terrestris]|uniref:NAD-dependent epimerase/dehydratase family protein n=1 Tax=Halonotius terrestris TaxID=2487750 RepID=A0A8J8PBS9_9EURY|nr:NAD-dependent epimerase/dehydratase family protein [Halonotius terrestris]TQQ81122.1 NAD-dependent epimerase/dehydratase family protein [Halonotius terrestris]